MNPLQLGTLDKAQRVLDLYYRKAESFTFSEIVEQTGLEKGSVQRLLYSLQAAGFLTRHQRYKRYSLAPRFLSFAVSYIQSDPVMLRGLPVLETLSRQTSESVGLSILDGVHTFFLNRIPNLVSHDFALLPVRRAAYATAAGRAIMAWLTPREIDAILENSALRRYTAHTITDPDAIRARLAQARDEGYAWQDGEVLEKEIGLAAPIFGEGNRPVAAVSLSINTANYTLAEARAQFAAMILSAAREISSESLPAHDPF